MQGPDPDWIETLFDHLCALVVENAFLGLERRAKKCLWIRPVWSLGVLTRMKERAVEVLACDAWTVDWATGSPVILSAKPVRVVEYVHDGEFRHLGYTASLTAHSRTAERALTTR